MVFPSPRSVTMDPKNEDLVDCENTLEVSSELGGVDPLGKGNSHVAVEVPGGLRRSLASVGPRKQPNLFCFVGGTMVPKRLENDILNRSRGFTSLFARRTLWLVAIQGSR
jgi:hypothetical protein